MFAQAKVRWTSLLAALAVAVSAAPASAAPEWQEGELTYSTAFSCASIIFGRPQLVLTTGAGAAFLADPEALPRAGEVFYARLSTAIVGDPCGGGGAVLPEFVPPAGVEVAVDAEHPVLWAYRTSGQEVTLKRDGTVVSPGNFGGVVVAAQENGQGVPWPLANSGPALQIHVPLRSERKLNGIATPTPACQERVDARAACRRDQVGDHLQIAVQVADGGGQAFLIPFIGLFVREAGPPEVQAPAAVRAATARRGIAVTIRTAPNATVTGSLTARRRALARLEVKADAQGVARLRVRLSAASLRFLRRAGGRARLEAVARTTDGALSAPTRRALRVGGR